MVLHTGSYFPDQELNPRTLRWECGVLTTAPPEKPSEILPKGLPPKGVNQVM